MKKTITFAACILTLAPALGLAETLGTASHSYVDGDKQHSTSCTTTRGNKSGELRTRCYTTSTKIIPFKDSVIGSWWHERKRKRKQARLNAEKFEQDIQALEQLRRDQPLRPEPRSLNEYLDAQVDSLIDEWLADQAGDQ